MFPTAQVEEQKVQVTVRQPQSRTLGGRGHLDESLRSRLAGRGKDGGPSRPSRPSGQMEDESTADDTAMEGSALVERASDETGQIHHDKQEPAISCEPNQGFQDDGDQGPSLPQGQHLHAAKRVWARLQRVARAPSIKDWFMKARNLEIVNQVPEGILIGIQDMMEEILSDEPELHTRQNLYAYPWDKSCLKSMPIDVQQFKTLDAYASKVNVTSSMKDLVSVLLQEAHSDLEKLRAIWIWICCHIEYDVKGYHHLLHRSCMPKNVLRLQKGVCVGYAKLFKKMCSIAGIKCKEVSGISKGRECKPGQVFRGNANHTWNAVFLYGRWHLLDSTWGSGIVDNSCTEFTFRYNEFYFLTHPALFITDHFPEAHEWQLLKPRLSLQQFEQNTLFRSDFYAEGLIAATPATAVIQTENGKATVLVESHSPALFLCELNEEQENCLMTLQRNGMKLEVYPQQTGTHSLKIYAKLFEDTKENYIRVLKYSLKCSSVDESIHLPKDLTQPVGPSWLSEQAGILKASPSGPIIHTDDGRCVVTFTRTEDLHFFATLSCDNSTIPEDMMWRHTWETCHGNQAELKIHLPHAGHFALLILVNKTLDSDYYQCALSYLLSCPNKSVMWPVFPQRFSDWEDNYELVAPLAGILPANCQVQFKLKLPGVSQVSEVKVKCGRNILPLTLSKAGFWEGTCNTSSGKDVVVAISKYANDSLWAMLKYKVEKQ